MVTYGKLKALKPSMRENKRYLMLRGNFERKDVEKAILNYVGMLGYSKASPIFITNNILAVNREEVDKVRASFAMSGKEIKVIRVSGTIKKLREKSK
ncbi:MAG: hypothetical protein WC781_04940 [Candidatus Pacearchaeota archaeon]|jgi:RNase P/RNase MRP subunit POP5